MDSTTATSLITLITGLAIGLIAGGGSVLVLIPRIKNDVALLTAIEALAKSASPEVIDALKKAPEVLRDTAAIIDEVTDDVPAADKVVRAQS